MNRRGGPVRSLALLLLVLAGSCAGDGTGSARPGTLPTPPDLSRFATDLPEFGLTRGPDGWYLSRMDGPFGSEAGSTMWHYPFGGGSPRAASFGTQSQAGRDFSYDPEGERGCFVRGGDIWCARWVDGRWAGAAALPAAINSPGYEASPAFAPDGSLYFASMREGGTGQGDIYRARRRDDGWVVDELPETINSPTGEWNLALSPDGTMLVFEASGRETNRSPAGDLYLSCLQNGAWQAARPMHALNTPDSDLDFRFTGPRSGVFTTAVLGGDGVLREAGPQHFAQCRE